MADNKTLWTWGNQQKYHEELMQEIEDNNTGSSTPVLNTATGNPITITDGADAPLIELGVYGKSVQNGIPTPETPIDIVSVGDDGDVEIMVDNDNGIALSAIVTSGLPLCSVGDYRDELIYNADGTGKIIKRIRKVVFDGSEKWNQASTTNEKYRMTMNIGGYESLYGDNYTNTTISLVVSDQYNAISYKQASEEINGIALLHTTGKHLSIYDENYATATVDEWKAHLAQNPLTVIYVLNTPQEIELSAAEMAALAELQTFEDVTNIYNDGNTEMYIKYWCDNNINTLLNAKAPLTHTHAVSDIIDFPETPDTSNSVSKSGDVMEGILIAQSNTDYTIAQVRNVTMSTEPASGGSNGQIHYQYE